MLNGVMLFSYPMAKIPKATLEYFRKQGARGGKLSAKARMEKLTPEQRTEVAKKAAAARWGTKPKKKRVPGHEVE
jgi:hypothetical protein